VVTPAAAKRNRHDWVTGAGGGRDVLRGLEHDLPLLLDELRGFLGQDADGLLWQGYVLQRSAPGPSLELAPSGKSGRFGDPARGDLLA